jgi:hypothetical protein
LFEPTTTEIDPPVRPVEVSKKIIGKEGKGMKAKHKKSQKCYISLSCRDENPEAISIKIGPHVAIVNVINSV